MSGQETILEVRDARRRYSADATALENAGLDLKAGCILALLGPSGSGKSTLLRAIAGLEKLDAGTIRQGETLWSGPGTHLPPEARRIGMVFQDYALFPHMTALANVAFGLTGPGKRERAMAQLAAAELGHKSKAYPHELSGGEQQRVALARALAPEPAIILLDEPFSGLDRRLRGELRDRTRDRLKQAGTTALLVTHDADEAFAVADEIALMDAGHIVQTGTPDHVWLNPVSAVAARLVGDVNIHHGRCADGQVDMPLGRVAAGDHADGDNVDVLIRPEAITVSADAAGAWSVAHCRTVGGQHTLRLVAGDGSLWTAYTKSPSPIGEGDTVSVVLDPQFIRVVASNR